jgi:hypothetical protein
LKPVKLHDSVRERADDQLDVSLNVSILVFLETAYCESGQGINSIDYYANVTVRLTEYDGCQLSSVLLSERLSCACLQKPTDPVFEKDPPSPE